MNTIFWVVEVGVQMTNPSAGVIQPIICGSGNPKQDIPWHFTKDTFYFLGIRDLKKPFHKMGGSGGGQRKDFNGSIKERSLHVWRMHPPKHNTTTNLESSKSESAHHLPSPPPECAVCQRNVLNDCGLGKTSTQCEKSIPSPWCGIKKVVGTNSLLRNLCFYLLRKR